jgi:hypothetical protein
MLVAFFERWGLELDEDACRRTYWRVLEATAPKELSGGELWAAMLRRVFECEPVKMPRDALTRVYATRLPLCLEKIPASVMGGGAREVRDGLRDGALQEFAVGLMRALLPLSDAQAEKTNYDDVQESKEVVVGCGDYFIAFNPYRGEIAICQ